jgi:hypothetical protein
LYSKRDRLAIFINKEPWQNHSISIGAHRDAKQISIQAARKNQHRIIRDR